MRPLRLSMTAFGPFPGTEEIDFRELGESRLFLIHGETGAGKSTILDGICTALYGESAGGERTPEEMRSDHADPEVRTELELDFCIGEKSYRIHRVPKQERPKKRGEGTVTVAAEAILWELEGAEKGAKTGAVLAERKVKLVGEKVVDLLGLQASQFRQVVVLPQGQFRRLLTAESAEREKILERLFDTAAYLRVERSLLDRKKALGKGIERSLQKRRGKLETQEVDSVEDLEAKIAGQALASRHLEAEAAEASAEAAKRGKKLQQAENVAKRFGELEAARTTLARLGAEAQGATADRARLGGAKEAAKLDPSFERMRSSEREFQKRAGAEGTAKKEAAEAAEALGASESTAKLAIEERSKSGERRDALEESKARAERVRGWRRRAQARALAEKHLEETTRRRDAAKEAREAEDARRLEVAKHLESLSSTEAELERARHSLTKAGERVDAHLALGGVATKLAEARASWESRESARSEAKSLAESSGTKVNELQAAHEAGSAAILARRLEDGAACPVCGAEDHPKPAEPIDALPTDEEREKAASAREGAQARLIEAEGQVSAAKTLQATLEEELASKREALDDETEAEAKKARGEAEESLELAKRRDGERVSQKAELDRLDASAKAVAEKAAETQQAQAKATAGLEGARAEESAALEGVGDGVRDIDALEARSTELQKLIESAEKAHETAQLKLTEGKARQAAAQESSRKAGAERREAEAAREERASAWKTELEESDFDDLGAFEAARLEVGELEALEAKLKKHDEEMAAAKAKVGAHEKALEGETRPELPALRDAAEGATAAAAAASDRVVALQTTRDQASRVLDEVIAEREATAELERDYAVVGRLANIASGENGAKLSLHRFVLAAFLDDVLIQASEHLVRMSRGRYILARRRFAEGSSDRRKKHGLDLDVFDHHTGEHRPATTLSGGEGFLAALALALGLADVVQAHAGGIRLETVFVDEGFGSLDPETLDLAAKTLMQLQKTGRLVGVISHVGELKERIDVRLEVAKTEKGSVTRFQLPN